MQKLQEKVSIFHLGVTACVECFITGQILKISVIRNHLEDEIKLPKSLVDQIENRQKIIELQYLFNMFDPSGFHLKRFASDFSSQLRLIGMEEIIRFTLDLFETIRKSVVIIRNNIGSHMNYDLRGQEKAYRCLEDICPETIEMILCLLRLISSCLSTNYGTGKLHIPRGDFREAEILEEVRKKSEKFYSLGINHNIMSKIAEFVTLKLIDEYYSKGIHPIFDLDNERVLIVNRNE